MKKVEIEWVNSKSGPNEWEFLDDLEPLRPFTIKTVGFLLEDTSEYKIVVSSVGGDQIRGRVAIPTSCILKEKKLQ